MLSPIPITEFISCVLIIVVMLNSRVILDNNSSMTSDVLGSKPELGSSQKRYFGVITMARAIATRFCIPPEISPGNFSSAPFRFTRSKHSCALLSRSSALMSENISSGKRTFSSTVSESKSADPWKIIPISRRMSIFSFLFMLTKLRPS